MASNLEIPQGVDIGEFAHNLQQVVAAHNIGSTAIDLRRDADQLEKSVEQIGLVPAEAPVGLHIVAIQRGQHFKYQSWETWQEGPGEQEASGWMPISGSDERVGGLRRQFGAIREAFVGRRMQKEADNNNEIYLYAALQRVRVLVRPDMDFEVVTTRKLEENFPTHR